MPDKIPISICVDIEPDTRCIDPRERVPWTGFEELHPYMNRQRELLEKATDGAVRFSWNLRLDPQIEHVYGTAGWAVERYMSLFEALTAEGDEIGLHPHAWRWSEKEDCWIGDHDNDEWIEHCVRLSNRAYRECFGKAPRVFRFGDRFMSNRIMGLLEELGILCDLTLEPGHAATRTLSTDERTTGWIPNYRRVPHAPYRPSRRNFRRPGLRTFRKLWEMPASTGQPRGIIPGLPYPAPRWLTMIIGFPFPAVKQIFEQRLSDVRPHIVALARTDVTRNPFTKERLDLFFDFLLTHPERERFMFVTPLEALKELAGETFNFRQAQNQAPRPTSLSLTRSR